jgi:hypothetical protein
VKGRVRLFLFFDGKSEERKRTTEAIVTAPLPTVKKNPDNDEQQKKRRRKRKRKKNMVASFCREKITHKTTLISHCRIVQVVPNVFHIFSLHLYDYKCVQYTI